MIIHLLIRRLRQLVPVDTVAARRLLINLTNFTTNAFAAIQPRHIPAKRLCVGLG